MIQFRIVQLMLLILKIWNWKSAIARQRKEHHLKVETVLNSLCKYKTSSNLLENNNNTMNYADDNNRDSLTTTEDREIIQLDDTQFDIIENKFISKLYRRLNRRYFRD